MGVLKQVGPMHRVPTCCLCRCPWVHSDVLSCASPLYPSQLITAPSFWCPCLVVVSTGLVVPGFLAYTRRWTMVEWSPWEIWVASGCCWSNSQQWPCCPPGLYSGSGSPMHPMFEIFSLAVAASNLVPCFSVEWEGPECSLSSGCVVTMWWWENRLSLVQTSLHTALQESPFVSHNWSFSQDSTILILLWNKFSGQVGAAHGLSECIKRRAVME